MGRHKRFWAVLAAAIAINGLPFAMAPAVAAVGSATVTPSVQLRNDATGSTFSYSFSDPVGTIGSVEITEPGGGSAGVWAITGCSLGAGAPAGWTVDTGSSTASKCVYTAGNVINVIPPATTANGFQVTATTSAGADVTAAWTVEVDNGLTVAGGGRSNTPVNITARALEITTAVVSSASATVGAACPADDKTDTAGATNRVIVVCGRNRSTGAVTTAAGANSTLSGTFVGSTGTFSGGSVPNGTGSSTPVVLGNWSPVTIGAAGSNKTVAARVGNGTSTSQVTTLNGYKAGTTPTTANDALTVNEGGSNSVSVLTNDSDLDGDSLTVTGSTNGANGTVNCTLAGSCTYNHNGSETTSDSFTYTASDPDGNTAGGTVNVTITAQNDAPVATAQSVNADEEIAKLITLAGTDAETASGSLAFKIAGLPSDGKLFKGNSTAPVDEVTALDVTLGLALPGNQVTYLGELDFSGSDSFTFKANDGTTDSAPATVDITVGAVNDEPTADGQTASVTEDEEESITLTGSTGPTNESGQALSFVVDTLPADGTLSETSGGAALTTGATLADATVFYTPATNSTTDDSFTFHVADDGGTANGGDDTSTTATATLDLQAVNDDPDAVDDLLIVLQGSSNNLVDVLANDSDPVDGDPVSVVAGSESDPAGGTASCTSSSCTYTPDAGFFGADSFTYTISDGSGGTDTASVGLTVEPAVTGGGGNGPSDTAAPIGQTTLETSHFSPNGDGLFDEASFEATFNETTEWAFEIVPESDFQAHPAAVVSLSGKGKTFAFTWDGSSGATSAAEGSYVWVLAGTDAAGNEMETLTGSVLVDRSAPLLTGIAASHERYRPARHGLLDIAFGVNEAASVKMKIVRKGKVYKRFGPSPTSDATDLLFTWNGRSSSGLRAPEGTYRVVIKAVDVVRNKVTNRALTFTLVR